MEVAVVLSAVQSATQLAGTCYEIGTFLYGIRTTYKESSSTMRSIETECRIFQASVSHIQQWLQAQTPTSSNIPQIQSVGSALGLINDSMKDMRTTLSKVTANTGTLLAGSWVKAKFVMYEDSLKTHLAALRENARLVQFTVTTLQLRIPADQTPDPPTDASSLEQVAAKAEALRRTHTVKFREKAQEQGNQPGSVADISQPPILQEQPSVMRSTHGHLITLQQASQPTQVLNSDTVNPLSVRRPEGHAQLAHRGNAPSKVANNIGAGQDQWTMGGPTPSVSQADRIQYPQRKRTAQSPPPVQEDFQTQSSDIVAPYRSDTTGNPQMQRTSSHASAPSISGATLVEHPQRIDTFPSPPSFTPITANTSASPQAEWNGAMSTSPKPSQTISPKAFGAAMTATPSSWDTWTPEMLAESEDEVAPPLPDGPPEKPAGYASHVAALATSFDDIRFKPEPPYTEGGQNPSIASVDPVSRPQTEPPILASSQYCVSDDADDASLMTNSTGVSALSTPTAPTSRGSSTLSGPSSVWSSDTSFIASSRSSRLSQAPTIVSTSSVRRKPIGVTKMNVQQSPIHEDVVAAPSPAESMRASPSSMSQADSWTGLTRHQSLVPDHHGPPGMHSSRKSANLSSPAVPTMSSAEFGVNRIDHEGYPLIVRAASDDRIDLVEKLLAGGAQKDATHTGTKRTALIEASEKGHARMVELLLDHGCSMAHVDSGGMSALHYAAQKGYLLVAKALLDRGAAADIQGLNGLTPLYLASWAPHANMVMLLLQRQANVNARDAWQRTALHVAASRGFTNICARLIDSGAQLETHDGSSKTPIQLSVGAQHLETVELLLSRSNLRPTDTNFLNAFFAAIEAGHVRMVEGFIDRGASLKGLKDDSHKPITLASKSGNMDMIDLVIRHKAKVKDRDKNGWTALHYAAHHGHATIIERLADKDIATNSTTSKKETPLHLAVKASKFASVDALLRGKGSSRLSSKDMYGQEPLHLAVRAGNMDIINLLMSNKANVSVDNAFGWKPLHIAVAYGYMPIATQLITLGASVEDRLSPTDLKKSETHTFVESGYWAEARWPFQGSKPIHLAIEFGRDDIARLLISRGAKVDSACGEGWRPLHLAAFNSSVPMVEYLLSLGAYPHAVTDTLRQRTPLDIARYRSQVSIPADLPGLPPVTDVDSSRVQELLNSAMASTPKKTNEVWMKQMRILAGKGPEEKSENLRAAALAGDVTGLNKQVNTRII